MSHTCSHTYHLYAVKDQRRKIFKLNRLSCIPEITETYTHRIFTSADVKGLRTEQIAFRMGLVAVFTARSSVSVSVKVDFSFFQIALSCSEDTFPYKTHESSSLTSLTVFIHKLIWSGHWSLSKITHVKILMLH